MITPTPTLSTVAIAKLYNSQLAKILVGIFFFDAGLGYGIKYPDAMLKAGLKTDAIVFFPNSKEETERYERAYAAAKHSDKEVWA